MGVSTQPLSDYIYVEKPEATKTSGGLFVNAPVDPAAPRLAKVIAVGIGRPSEYTGILIPMPSIVAGDWVLIHGNEGIRLPNEGENVYAIQPRAIIGKQVA